jgi:hypothetical protein
VSSTIDLLSKLTGARLPMVCADYFISARLSHDGTRRSFNFGAPVLMWPEPTPLCEAPPTGVTPCRLHITTACRRATVKRILSSFPLDRVKMGDILVFVALFVFHGQRWR